MDGINTQRTLSTPYPQRTRALITSEISALITFAISPRGRDDETFSEPLIMRFESIVRMTRPSFDEGGGRERCVLRDGERRLVGVWLPCRDEENSFLVVEREDGW